MYIRDIATANVITLTPCQTVERAIELMERHNIHHLPIVANDILVGMVSDRDLLFSIGWAQAARTGCAIEIEGPPLVEEIMSPAPQSLSPRDSVWHAIYLMLDRKINALPVALAGKINGLVTSTDVLRSFQSLAPDNLTVQEAMQLPVRRIMQTRVITIQPRASIGEITDLFRERRIRHLPVVTSSTADDEMVVGIVSDRDIRRALGASARCDAEAIATHQLRSGPTSAADIMTRTVITISPQTLIAEAIDIMLSKRIHALPVVSEEILAGLITDSDIMRKLADAVRLQGADVA